MRPPSGPRVLWVPYTQKGSLYPVVPAVQALRQLGADITLLGLPDLEPLADTLGTRFAAYESGISYDWSKPEGRDQHGLGPANDAGWFNHRVADEYSEIERASRMFRPDVLLVDSFVIGAGLAAESLGIPRASYVHYLFDESAEIDAMHRIWWEQEGESEIRAYSAWWDGVRMAVGLGPEPRGQQEAPWFRMSPECTFLLGHPHLRRGARRLPHFVMRTSLPPWDEPVGLPGTARAAPASRQRPRVLVANSSAWQDDADLVSACLAGLGDAEVEIVVTVSADHSSKAEPPANAIVLGYWPHTELLPSVDAVVTTAGYGLSTKALWFGKPLITVPRARDQHYVAAAVEENGCGISVAWPPRPDAVASAVKAVLASPAIQERARRLSGPMPGFPSARDVAAAVISLTMRA